MKREPSIKERVIKTLFEHGPMKVEQMMEYVKGVQQTSIHSKCLELLHDNLLTRNDDMVWALAEGVTPEGTGMEESTGRENTTGGGGGGATIGETGKTLEPKEQFAQLVRSTGVQKDIVPTITNMLFNGDWDDLNWVNQVILRNAGGFVSKPQAKMIITSWAQMRSLPYNPDDFPLEEAGKGDGKKAGEKEPPKSAAATVIEESGIGYKVVKDRDGDWVPAPGGPLTYEAALSAAQKSNTIKALSSGQAVEGSEEPAESGGAKTPAKGGKAARTFQEILMEKVIDAFIEGKQGKGDEDSPAVKRISEQLERATATIADMKEDRERDWRERMEANLATALARDPWSDPAELARARQLLGIPSTTVTDQSPAVQLIRDSTDKLDKNMNRLVGIVEQAALKTDQFRPEETRTPAEKEAKAGALLDEASKRGRSLELRKRTFGT